MSNFIDLLRPVLVTLTFYSSTWLGEAFEDIACHLNSTTLMNTASFGLHFITQVVTG